MGMDIRQVKTWSEFLRLSPAFREAAELYTADELTGLFETAARVKFFDRDIFEHIFDLTTKRTKSRDFNFEQLKIIMNSLVDLNAYHRGLFEAVASQLRQEVGTMTKEQRLQWLTIVAGAKSLAGADNSKEVEAFEDKLRNAPLPEGEPGTEGTKICFDFMKNGSCPRGKECKWAHVQRPKHFGNACR